MSRSSLIGALLAAALAASVVAFQRVGLGLALLCLLTLCVAAGRARRGAVSALLLMVGAGLALQPALRDAGWVVVLDVSALLVTAGALAVPPRTWPALARAAARPLAVPAGLFAVGRALGKRSPDARSRNAEPVLRGAVLAVAGVGVFGALFVAADSAFADVAEGVMDVDLNAGRLLWRLTLAALTAGAVGALAAAPAPELQAGGQRWAPGVSELRIALGALVLLFVAFVAVQLRVVFGGAAYVRSTTGLGLGEYARQGFVQMLVVVGLTLAVVGVAARREDRLVRGLLGALCALCLVILLSAWLRLGLVVDAYGLTRARVTGEAVILALGAMLMLVLAAGLLPGIAELAPRLALTGLLAGTLAFSLANPDARVARRAVEQQQQTGDVDSNALAHLSADALPQLRQLREPARSHLVRSVTAGLARPDGAAGWNFSRARAR